MGKRFTASEKWDKEWFMNLSCKHKCLWVYINDKCDQAGMWEANYAIASLHIGEKVSADDLKAFGERVEKYSEGKVWIVDHVEFQSGTLSEKSPAHKPIYKLLTKYRLLDRVLGRVSNTLQEKEREKEKDMEKEKPVQKPFSDVEFYADGKHAFADITSNYHDTEKARQILTNRGWRTCGDDEVKALLFHFLEAKADLGNDRKDVKRHFKNWLNREPVESLVTLSKNIMTNHGRN